MAFDTTAALVKAMLPSDVPLDVTSTPSTSAVTTWAGQITNQVNVALLQGGLDKAALTADQNGALQLACTKEGAYMVLVARGASGDGTHKPFWVSWHEEFEALLKAVRAGEWGGAIAGGTVKPWCYTIDAATDTTDTTIQPKFVRDKVY